MTCPPIWHALLGLLIFAMLPFLGWADEPQPGGLFVAVGYGGRRISSTDGVHWRNDTQWEAKGGDDDFALFNVAFGKGKFVAVGGGARVGHVLVTADGKDWREVSQQKGRVATVAFGDGRFVADTSNKLLFSVDGEQWQAGATMEQLKGSVHCRKSAFGNGVFVIIGDWDPYGRTAKPTRLSFRLSTKDGTGILHAETDAPQHRGIAFGGLPGKELFVVVGPDGLADTSLDGVHWTHRQTAPAEDHQAILWTGEKFLLAGGTTGWSSPDGVTWTRLPKPIPCGPRAAGGGLLVGSSWGGNLWRSTDGVAWTKIDDVPKGNSFEAVVYGRLGLANP